MKNRKCLFILFGFMVLIILFYTLRSTNKGFKLNFINNRFSPFRRSQEIVLAVVACNYHRLPETLNMLKSALLFNQNKEYLKFVIITETELMTSFKEKLDDWKEISDSFTYEILPLTFPDSNKEAWKNLFKPCAAQRLFLPQLLKDIDSVLYMDTDTLFLSPISEIWSFFKSFNSTQMAGLSPEHEDSNVGWYNRFARHPYYGPLGVNSGVMLMNLTRMREFQWEEKILPIYKEYRLKITWGDQDIINILFHFHPEKLFVFPCEWNYRPDHCMYMSVCRAPDGIKIVHGNRGYFHSDKQPAFSSVYKAVEEYRLGSDPYRNFLLPLMTIITDTEVTNSNCGKVKDEFLIKSKIIFKETSYSYE